jgi:hypothetical protein
MSDWKRTTKEIPFESLPSEMVSAVHRHIEQYNLGPILSEVLMCIQSDSEKRRKGLFGKTEIVQMGAVVTPRWLLWSVTGSKTRGVTALSAQLTDLSIQDYAQTPFAKMVPDSGIQVSGMFTDASESVSAFIGLEENDAGNKFKEVVIRTAQDAKK